MLISILNYDCGNLGSIANLLIELGYHFQIISSVAEVQQSDVLILPGQGAISSAMTSLRKTGLDAAICTHIQAGKPLLGICLGMQILLDFSEEDGGVKGLGVVKGRVKKFTPDLGIRIPHMGWNELVVTDHGKAASYFKGILSPAYAYFAHSYYAEPDEANLVLTYTEHGKQFASSLAFGSVLGIQCHPEKSAGVGIALVKNFFRAIN